MESVEPYAPDVQLAYEAVTRVAGKKDFAEEALARLEKGSVRFEFRSKLCSGILG